MSDDILIIDKDVSHAKALCVYLERKRMESHVASTTGEALVLFENISAQVVLADPGLPDIIKIDLVVMPAFNHGSKRQHDEADT